MEYSNNTMMRTRKVKKQKKENLDEAENIFNSNSTSNNVNTMDNQVPEEGSDQIESSSRYLVQVVYPLTLEPELEHKEAEMGELGEAEMAGQIAFEENVPLEKEPLSGEIQASSWFEEVTIQKSISRAGCSSPSLSLKLTEVVAMVRNEDGDEVDSEIRSRGPEDTINGYQVKPEFMPILRKIIGKHRDIAKNCMAKSVKYRSMLLEMICGIISELDEKNVTNIKDEVLKSNIGLVDEIKSMKVEVEWLRMRLTEVLDARDILKKFVMLKEKRDNDRKLIEDAESELEECEEKKEVTEVESNM